jgi:hypothetical protein
MKRISLASMHDPICVEKGHKENTLKPLDIFIRSSKNKCLFTGKFDIQVFYPDIVPQKSRLGTWYAPLFTGGRKKLEFHTTPLSPPAATFDALVLMNRARGTVETLQRIPPGLPNDKPWPEMAHSSCRHHRLQLNRLLFSSSIH